MSLRVMGGDRGKAWILAVLAPHDGGRRCAGAGWAEQRRLGALSGQLLLWVVVLAFEGRSAAEATGYLAGSMSFRASGPPFFTYASQAPGALGPGIALARLQCQQPARGGGA
jgi:hypothetical protein